MKIAFAKEELFLVSIMMPLGLGIFLLLSTVRPPQDLFTVIAKKPKPKMIQKVQVKNTAPAEVAPKKSLPSLSQTLAPPKPSLGGDLKSLSVGVVSEGSGSGSGSGLSISQGETNPTELINKNQGGSRPARAVNVVNPVYPQTAQARGIEGHVILEVSVSERGTVSDAKVVSAEPQGIFETVAIEAVRKWTFDPALQDGKTVASKLKQKVNFELN